MKRVHRLISLILIAFIMMPVPLAAEAAGTASFAADEIVAVDETASGSDGTTASVDLSDVSEDTAATDELLVLVESETTKRETSKIADEAGASLENISELNDGSRLARVSLDDPKDMQEVADSLASEDCVVIVQPNYIYKAYEDGADAEADAAGSEEEAAVIDEAPAEGMAAGADGALTDGDMASEEAAKEDETASSDGSLTEEGSRDEDEGSVTDQAAGGSEAADDRTGLQWYLKSPDEIAGGIDAYGAWSMMPSSGNKISVAVIDSGADLSHIDLKDVILEDKCVTINAGTEYDFTKWDNSNDDDGHGTHVCGIIAAKVDSYGISGVANNRAELMVIDAALPNGNYTTQDIVLSIDYAAANGAKLINMSIGGLYRDLLLEKAVSDAYDKGALCICASGNEGSALPQSPGDTACAVSVMSHDKYGSKDIDSNHGSEKDVSAPGEKIYSTYTGMAKWKYISGTSMAAPMVTGLAVLILSENESLGRKSLSPRQLKNFIYTSSGSGAFNGSIDAFGRINAKTAIENVRAEASEPKKIVLNRTSASMYPGETVDLEYAVWPGTASIYADGVRFSSSDEEVASVDEKGRVSAAASGEAVITASCGDVETKCTINVRDADCKAAVLPLSVEGTLSPSDPKVTVTTGTRTWGSYVDTYELELLRGQTVNIAVEPSAKDSSAIIPCVRVMNAEGDVNLLKRGRAKKTLLVSYEAEKKGTYRLQVLGETMGGADEEKPYRLEIEDISNASVSGVANKTFTGSEIRPAVTVRYGSVVLAEGTDYKVEYKKNKNVGTAAVKVTGSGGYSFSLTRTFRILPKGTKISKLTRARKAAGVRWKKQTSKMSSSRITGYQIQMATDADFTKNKKTVTVSGYKKTYKKIKGLKAKTKYYVRIRTYKKVDGTKYYSAWSKTRTVKTR